MDDLKPLFPDKKEPAYIWYAAKPPKLGGIPVKLSIEKFNQIIGNGYVYTENVYFKKQAEMKSSELQKHNFRRNELLEFIKNPFNDKLVICYMGPKVGHGVFARKDITVGEMIALYTGELLEIRKNDFLNPYCLRHGLESTYCIDAMRCGGIARFFQHLPLSVDETIRKSVPSLQKNSFLLKRYLANALADAELPPEYHSESEQMLKEDILNNNGQDILKKMFLHCRTEWHLNKFLLHNGTIIKEIATENIEHNFSVIDGKLLTYFCAQMDIKKGEQIGFSYGEQYWITSGKMPVLFDQNGGILASENYKYTEIPFIFETPQNKMSAFYNKRAYEMNALSQKPIKFRPNAEEISFFSSRKKLAKNNVLDSSYLPLDSPNTFVLNLREILGNAFKIELYERFPESKNDNERYVYDVVCKANSIEDWKKLHSILKESAIDSYCSYYESTQEIVIKGVNVYSHEMYEFTKELLPTEAIYRL